MRKPTVLSLLLLPQTVAFQRNFLPRRQSQQRRFSVTPLPALQSEKVSLFPEFFSVGKKKKSSSSLEPVEQFLRAYNTDSTKAGSLASSLLTDDCQWDDYAFYTPSQGTDAVQRRLGLQADIMANSNNQLVVDVFTVDDADSNKVGVEFHLEKKTDGHVIPNSKGLAFFELSEDEKKIRKIDWAMEPAVKGAEAGLRILSIASNFMDEEAVATPRPSNEKTLTLPEQYFAAWNRRDMDSVVALFTRDVIYDDTAFPEPFQGTDALRAHVIKCEKAFPKTFTFEVDDVIQDRNSHRVLVKWHVENDGQPLLFTRGCSSYVLDDKNQRIKDGMDIVEPAVWKPGRLELLAKTTAAKVVQEPIRILPVTVWLAYMYIVFFSDGILPGANALQLEARTWEEVRDLSLNFFLVAPALHLPFSPTVHPMLEAVFNVLLSWAAMFAGFLSDDRSKDKPSVLPMPPIVIGMQFLTSAFLLPYLAIRAPEHRTDVFKEELSRVAQVCESPLLGVSMAIVGSYSLAWACLGRVTEFGASLSERWSSFIDILSIDRVGSSFLVDLVLFAFFQSWFVDDDLKRRGVVETDPASIRQIGKYVPFFGLAAYLMLRPPLCSEQSVESRGRDWMPR
jgi:ketosteroid isomerase-like protein